jgi:hypothetical protein
MNQTKPRSANDRSLIVAVLVVRRLTMAMTDVSNFIQDRLVAIVCEHERQHRGHMMKEVMTAFQQQFGKPAEQLCHHRRNAPFHTGMRKIFIGAVDQYPEW